MLDKRSYKKPGICDLFNYKTITRDLFFTSSIYFISNFIYYGTTWCTLNISNLSDDIYLNYTILTLADLIGCILILPSIKYLKRK